MSFSKKTWLLQRCTMRKEVKPGQVTGFDSAFSNDYMGSAEFEFGALPKSLRAVTPHLDKYQIYQDKRYKKADGQGLFLFCTPEMKEEVLSRIELLYRDEINLKERSGLADCLNAQDEKGYGTDINLWWDIENHFFFGIGKPTIQRLELALTRLKEKWAEKDKIKAA